MGNQSISFENFCHRDLYMQSNSKTLQCSKLKILEILGDFCRSMSKNPSLRYQEEILKINFSHLEQKKDEVKVSIASCSCKYTDFPTCCKTIEPPVSCPIVRDNQRRNLTKAKVIICVKPNHTHRDRQILFPHSQSKTHDSDEVDILKKMNELG